MIHIIENSFIEVQIKEFGAELCSLKKKNDDYEYIWQADEKYWGRYSPILFPIVGKLIDDEYFYNGKIYKMSQHGFARDMLFELYHKENDQISLGLKSSEQTFSIYPFNFELIITYKLIKNSLNVEYKVINHTNNKMLFSIGAHPAFNWNREKKAYLEFFSTKQLERVPLTPLGLSSKKKIIILENNKLQLNDALFKDDAVVVENLKNKSIIFKNTQNNKNIKVSFEKFPYLGIWSKPTGASFICIEPWYGVADEIEHNKQFEKKKGIISLEPNKVFESNYQISIE